MKHKQKQTQYVSKDEQETISIRRYDDVHTVLFQISFAKGYSDDLTVGFCGKHLQSIKKEYLTCLLYIAIPIS